MNSKTFYILILLSFLAIPVACGGPEPETEEEIEEEEEQDDGDPDESESLPLLSYLSQPGPMSSAGQPFSLSLGFLDENDQILNAEGIEITLELSRGTFADGETTVTESTTNAGIALFSLIIENADQGYVLTARATLPDDDEQILNSELFDVMAGSPSESTSWIYGESYVPADGESTAEVIVELADSFGNPLRGVNPVITASGGGTRVEGCSSTDSLGRAHCAISSSEPGQKVLEILEPLTMTGDSIFFLRTCDEDGVPFGGGDGSTEDPYLLCAIEHLLAIGDEPENMDAHFVLTKDIDLSVVASFPGIGSNEVPFSGFFDGRGFTIRNLTIDAPDEDLIGFFNNTDWDAEIRDLHLEDIDIVGHYYVGGLVGHNNGSIQNSSTTGVLSATHNAGGLIGRNFGRIHRSSADVDIRTTDLGEEAQYPPAILGGLVGHNTYIAARPYPNTTGIITESYALGDITQFTDQGGEIGGLVGAQYGFIADSFALGSVTTSPIAYSGGLAGMNVLGGSITRSYALGAVSEGISGGLVGRQGVGNTFFSFWDQDTSQMTAGFGESNPLRSVDATPLTTAQFANPQSFPEWDFDTIWTIDVAPDGATRPILRWMLQD